MRGNLGVGDAAVLLAIFVAYLYIAKKLPPLGNEKLGELAGPAFAVASMKGLRKGLAIALFAVQLVFPPVRFEVSVLYLVLAAVESLLNWGRMAVLSQVSLLVKEHLHR